MSDILHISLTPVHAAHKPNSCIGSVSICELLPQDFCHASAKSKPYWPPGAHPVLFQSLKKCHLVDAVGSCSWHRWHPSPATPQSESASVQSAKLHASEHQIWQPLKTVTVLLGWTWAVSDAVWQLTTRNQIKIRHNQKHEKGQYVIVDYDVKFASQTV